MAELTKQALALGGVEKPPRILFELGAQLLPRHRIFGRTAIVFFDLLELAAILEDDLDCSFEPPAAWIIGVGEIGDAARERENLRIAAALGAVGRLAERAM